MGGNSRVRNNWAWPLNFSFSYQTQFEHGGVPWRSSAVGHGGELGRAVFFVARPHRMDEVVSRMVLGDSFCIPVCPANHQDFLGEMPARFFLQDVVEAFDERAESPRDDGLTNERAHGQPEVPAMAQIHEFVHPERIDRNVVPLRPLDELVGDGGCWQCALEFRRFHDRIRIEIEIGLGLRVEQIPI